METFTAQFMWTITHLMGVAVGFGGALFGDYLFFASAKNGVVSRPELRMLTLSSRFIWIGLALLFISGAGLFFLDTATYLASEKFLAKMLFVGVIAVNGFIFHTVHFATLKRLVGVPLHASALFRRKSYGMFASGAISVVSWLSALVLGSLRSLPYSFVAILSVYALCVGIGVMGALVVRRVFLSAH